EALLQEYRMISEDYPEAAIPHFRCQLLHGKLKNEPEAKVALLNAVRLVGDDPYLRDMPHHLGRSTLLRRLEIAASKETDEMLDGNRKLKPGVRKEDYVALRLMSLQTLRDGFEAADDPLPDHFYELEQVRRINNIVYSAVLCADVEGDFTALE